MRYPHLMTWVGLALAAPTRPKLRSMLNLGRLRVARDKWLEEAAISRGWESNFTGKMNESRVDAVLRSLPSLPPQVFSVRSIAEILGREVRTCLDADICLL